MDLIIIVVAIVALVGLIVVMFRYAGFIHQGPSSSDQDKSKKKDPAENSSNKDSE